MRLGVFPIVLAAGLGLVVAGCQKVAEDDPARVLVAKSFAKPPVFTNVVTRTDPVGRTVVCGTAAGIRDVPAPVKANEPPRDKPLYIPTQITTRFFVVEGEAVLEYQDNLYTGADPSVKASADDYQALTLQWFRVGWDKMCTDQPPQPAS